MIGMGDNEQTPALPDHQLILRAICDPGKFTPRGDYQGEPFGETVQRWSMRAVQQVIGEWLAGRTVLELPRHDEIDAGNYRYGPEAVWHVVDDAVRAFTCRDGASVDTGHDVMGADRAECYGLAVVAAAREARRLASESSGDGEQS